VRVVLDTNVLVAAFATRGICEDGFRTVLAEHELGVSKFIHAGLEPVLVDSLTLQAAVSVGVAYFPDHANNPGQLIRGVEMAVYAAKSAGRNCWRVAPGPDTIPTSR